MGGREVPCAGGPAQQYPDPSLEEAEAGPDRHGITQGSIHYVFGPGGNRIELFGDPGILELEPDFETRTWTVDNIDTGTAIGGTNLPAETYFV